MDEWGEGNIDGDDILFHSRVKGTTSGSVHGTQAGSQSALKTLANAMCCLSLKHHEHVGVPVLGFEASHDTLFEQKTWGKVECTDCGRKP